MASLTCFASPQITPKDHKVGLYGRVDKLYGLRLAEKITKAKRDSSFLGGCRLRIGFTPEVEKHIHSRQTSSGVCCSCMSSSEIVSSAFTLGTAAVLPFYTLMLAAPKAELTKKAMRSSLPYVGLGVLYAYLLWLSWTPDTMRLMFASNYWLPELEGIAKMFSSETTLASAWIHLLVVDLFAARQVYEDGLENEVETRHSVALCLLFCPVGIISHVITKRFTNASKTTTENDTEI